MKMLEGKGVPTHFVEELSDRETLVKKVEIVPLEVIVRNVAAGHFSLRMGVPEGKVFKTPILEYSYKNDDLHDPFINHYYALALDLATQEELDEITAAADAEMTEAVKFADESEYPDPATVLDDMYVSDNERCVAR